MMNISQNMNNDKMSTSSGAGLNQRKAHRFSKPQILYLWFFGWILSIEITLAEQNTQPCFNAKYTRYRTVQRMKFASLFDFC